MEEFTLQEFAFPVAPDSLDGFTIDNFAWVELEEVVVPLPPIDNVTLDFSFVEDIILDFKYTENIRLEF